MNGDWAWVRERCVAEAARIVRRAEDAEEVVQEALIRAWRSRASCKTPENPLPWCLQITRNEAFRLLARQRGEPLPESLPGDDALERSQGPGEWEKTLIRVDVGRALKELTPRERLLIALRYERDWSHPEIAHELRTPEATVRVWLHRAHKRLRSALEGSP